MLLNRCTSFCVNHKVFSNHRFTHSWRLISQLPGSSDMAGAAGDGGDGGRENPPPLLVSSL